MLHKGKMSLFRIAVPLKDSGREPAHGVIAAPLKDRTGARALLLFRLISLHDRTDLFIDRHPPFMPDHFSGIRAENEPCRIQRIVIEKRVLLLDSDLQAGVYLLICNLFDLEINMEPRSLGLAILHLHVVTAERYCIGIIPEQLFHLLQRDPFFRILGVIVVTIHDRHIGADEVFLAAVVLLIFTAHMVLLDGFLQLRRVPCFHPVRVQAVLRVRDHIGRLQH